MAELPRDTFGRPLASLRLSVTDRCNLRCRYCMPEDEYVWLPRTAILTFEEIGRRAAAPPRPLDAHWDDRPERARRRPRHDHERLAAREACGRAAGRGPRA